MVPVIAPTPNRRSTIRQPGPNPPSAPSGNELKAAAVEQARPSSPPSPKRHDAFPYVAPFAVFIVLMIADPWVRAALAPFTDPAWSYAVRAAVTLAVLVALWPRYGSVWTVKRAGARAWGWGLVVGVVVFGLWINLDVRLLTVGDPTAFDPTRDGRLHPGLVASRLLGATLVVPIMEELFWRGFLMRWLHRPRFLGVAPAAVSGKALLLSSAVFATEHRLWFAGLLAGLAYGELYRRTGDLRVAMVAHAVTNGLLGAWVVGTSAWTFW